MLPDHVISLGGNCQTAFQIHDKFPGQSTFPFDWLVTPFDSVPLLLESGFHNMVHEDALGIDFNGRGVLNTKFHVVHYHDFPKEGQTIASGWRADIGSVSSKFNYLADRWEKVMRSSARVLFVRYRGRCAINYDKVTEISVADANALVLQIGRKYPSIDFRILFVSAITVDDPAPLDKRAFCREIKSNGIDEWEHRDDFWKGSRKEWSAVFDSCSTHTWR